MSIFAKVMHSKLIYILNSYMALKIVWKFLGNVYSICLDYFLNKRNV